MLSTIQRKDYMTRSNNDTDRENPSADYLLSYIPLDQLPRKGSPKSILSIRGQIQNGQMNGMMHVEYVDGTSAEGYAVDGAWHGIVRYSVKA